MSSNHRDNPTTAPSSSYRAISSSAWITLIVISSVGLIPMYGETVIIPAIPDFIKEFGISYNTSSWILAAFLIAGAVMTPISGKLSDIYGKKKIILVIMCIYTIGVTLGGFASNISFMIIARILQGIGLSMFPIAFGIIKLQFPKEKISIAQGMFTGVFTAGSAIGLALGGTIIYHYGWHFALLSMVPAAIILILIVRKFIHIKEEEEKEKQQQQPQQQQPQQQQPQQSKVQKSKLGTEYCCVFTKIGNEEERQEYFHPKINEVDNSAVAESSMHNDKNNNNSSILKKIDIKGAITLSATIISFLMTLSFLVNIHSSSSTMSGFIAVFIFSIVSIVSLMLFIVVERKVSAKKKAAKTPMISSSEPSSSSMATTEAPLVDLNLLTNRIILLNNISLMILGITMFMVYQSISVLIRSPPPLGFGGSAISAANVQIPFTIIILVVSVSAGIIISKFGNVKPSLVGTIISTFGFFSLFLFHSSELLITANLAVIAIGLTLTRVGNWNILLEYTPKDSLGISLGMTAMLFFVGMAIGPAIASIYMQSNQIYIKGSSLLFPSLESYNMIFITACFISVISIALMLALKKKVSTTSGISI